MSRPQLKCPKCASPLETAHLPEGIDIETCPNCCGAYYDAAELTVAVTLENVGPGSGECPKCRMPMEIGLYRGALALDRCAKCRALWFDAGEIHKLRKLSGIEGVIGPGKQGSEPPPPLRAAPLAAMAQKLSAKSEASGRKSQDDFSASVEPPDGSTLKNPDETLAPALRYQGETYQHFQTSVAKVSFVLGEFNWQVKVGDQAKLRDFVAPPLLLSEEITGKESVWSQGAYLDPQEVADGFKIAPGLPMRVGVAPAQPNPHDEGWGGLLAAFWLFAAAVVGIGFVFASTSSGKTVHESSYTFASADTEKSKITADFEVTGRRSNLAIQTETDFDNKWAYFAFALINAQTDEALDFGREISFYQGTDDGEYWSEGSRRDTVYLPKVPAGRYYLRIEPETDVAGTFRYSISVRRDVFRPGFVVLALALIALPVGWVMFRRRAFEVARWAESDHPWVVESDDDDDDD